MGVANGKRYSIGIIGAGSIVESCHLPVLKAMQQVEVSWLFDANIERSRLLADMYNVPVLEKEWEKGIQDIDICLVTIPYGARKPYLEKIAAEKKSVYVEKPFAITYDEHLNWCGLFPGANLAIGFQRRFYAIVAQLKSIVESGIFGKLNSIDFKQGYFSLKGGGSYLSDARMAGGGVIIESAIHALDQILYFTGASNIQLLSIKSISRKGIDYDTVFATNIHHQGIDITVNAHVSTLQNLDNGLKLYFEKAEIETSLSPDALIKVRAIDSHHSFLISPHQYSTVEIEGAESVIASFGMFWESYIDAIATEKVNNTSGVSSLLTTKWVESIYAHIK